MAAPERSCSSPRGGHPLLGSVAGVGDIVVIGTLVVLVVLLDGTYRRQLL